MATVTVNGVRLAYDDVGSGPPVIWVHGGFTDRRGFDLVVPLLTDWFRVVAYDRRGHSQSERRPGEQSVAHHVADLAALVERLDAAPAHLVASSDGGEVALKAALARPELVASLCLHEPSLPGILPPGPAVDDYRARLARMADELARGDPEAAARLLVDAFVGGEWEQLPEQTRRTFVHNGPTWLDTVQDPSYGTVDGPETVTGPVLVSTGELSDPVDRAIAGRLAEMLPRARLHTFEAAGHVPHRTHPVQFADVVRAFIRQEG